MLKYIRFSLLVLFAFASVVTAQTISKDTLFGAVWHNGREMGGESLEFFKDGTVKNHDDVQDIDTMGKWSYDAGKKQVTVVLLYKTENGTKEFKAVYAVTYEDHRDKNRYLLRGVSFNGEEPNQEQKMIPSYIRNWLNEQN